MKYFTYIQAIMYTVLLTLNVHFSLFHILHNKSVMVWCMTIINVSNDRSFLALQVGAPPVMSYEVIVDLWLLKGKDPEDSF